MNDGGEKLPFPAICECGFNTMDAKEAHDHAMMHEKECWKVKGEDDPVL